MACKARPTYSAVKCCYVAYVGGKKVSLVKGGQNETNHNLALKKLRDFLRVRMANPGLDRAQHTVASVIEQYLRFSRENYSPEAFEERRYYLQLFAEAHGWRKANDRDWNPSIFSNSLPITPNGKGTGRGPTLVHIIMRPFNGAAKNRLIPSNPFRGVEQAAGAPRRPLTDICQGTPIPTRLGDTNLDKAAQGVPPMHFFAANALRLKLRALATKECVSSTLPTGSLQSEVRVPWEPKGSCPLTRPGTLETASP